MTETIEHSTQPPAVPPRRWYQRRSRQAAIAAGGGAVALCGWLLTPSSFELDGTLSTTGSGFTSYGATAGGCTGYGGYSDLSPGTSVTVYDDTGKIVALGALGAGTSSALGGCQFSYAVKDVPSGSHFYSVEVSHRGKVTFTAEAAENGQAALSIGGS